jgi:hypothetical protein
VRTALYQMLQQDAELFALVGDRIHGSSGTDGEDDQSLGIARPFIVIRMSGDFPGAGSMMQRSAEVWAHQEPGSYVEVDRILKRVRACLKETPFGHDGEWIVDAIYTQTSPDLYDQTRRTNCRMSAFTITGNEAT